MSRVRLFIAFVVVGAAFLALAILPDRDVDDDVMVQADDRSGQTDTSSGLMMAVTSHDMPVFGFPTHIYRPHDHTAETRSLLDVDAVYRELATPQLGVLQASPASACATRLSASRSPAAMVTLNLRAPCLPDERFVIRHGPIAFAMVTDPKGQATLDAPALYLRSTYAAFLDNIEHATAEVIVPEVRSYDRVVIHWKTNEAIDLHAFEGRATIGGEGHVWSASPRTRQEARAGVHGFLQELQDGGDDLLYRSQVYTFPAGVRNSDNWASLRVGNLLNIANCNREFDFAVIEVYGGMAPVTTRLSPRMPSCGQIGYMVLLADDLPAMAAAARGR